MEEKIKRGKKGCPSGWKGLGGSMRKYQMLLKAAIKRQKGSIAGIFLLVFVLSLCLFCAITVYISGIKSVESEMQRLGFGDFTI